MVLGSNAEVAQDQTNKSVRNCAHLFRGTDTRETVAGRVVLAVLQTLYPCVACQIWAV